MAKKLKKDAVIEGKSAYRYAELTKADLDGYRELAKKVSENLKKQDHVLEIAPGAGYTVIELAKIGTFDITAMDLSFAFVEIGKKLALDTGVNINFCQGNVSNMPFKDESFDFIFNRAAFKNFKDPVKAISEMYRVLKVSGKVLIEDLKPDLTFNAVNETVNKMKMNGFNRLITKIIFIFGLKKTAHSKEEFEKFIAQSRFSRHEILESSIGYEVWLYK